MKVLVLLLAVLALPMEVQSHAVLVSSTPRDNSTVKSSPKRVVLNFDARIEKNVSRVSLSSTKGPKVALKMPDGGYTGGKVNQLIVPMPLLKPGSYKLEYRVLASDGHLTPGLVRFTVSGGKSP